jgi:hypothetical protein
MEHPGDDDLPYLRAHFVPLDDLARAHGREPRDVRSAIADGLLPRPAYVLVDGSELVAPDHLALTEAAGGDAALPAWFAGAFARAAAGGPLADEADAAWDDYRSGLYAACLRSVTPATIVRKAVLVARVEAALAAGAEADLAALRADVDALDALLRPFAAFDRLRFGGSVSRDRLVTAPRCGVLSAGAAV